jgi:hypothetical protein
MAVNRWRGSPPLCPDSSGEGPGKADSLYHNRGLRQTQSDLPFVFANKLAGLLCSNRTDLNRVAVERAGHLRLFARLLIQNRERCLVARI